MVSVVVFPSSHTSGPLTALSPQYDPVRFTTPVQVALQPVQAAVPELQATSVTVLPSSHASHALTAPLPQNAPAATCTVATPHFPAKKRLRARYSKRKRPGSVGASTTKPPSAFTCSVLPAKGTAAPAGVAVGLPWTRNSLTCMAGDPKASLASRPGAATTSAAPSVAL